MTCPKCGSEFPQLKEWSDCEGSCPLPESPHYQEPPKLTDEENCARFAAIRGRLAAIADVECDLDREKRKLCAQLVEISGLKLGDEIEHGSDKGRIHYIRADIDHYWMDDNFVYLQVRGDYAPYTKSGEPHARIRRIFSRVFKNIKVPL